MSTEQTIVAGRSAEVRHQNFEVFKMMLAYFTSPNSTTLRRAIPYHDDMDLLLGDWSAIGEPLYCVGSLLLGILFSKLVRSSTLISSPKQWVILSAESYVRLPYFCCGVPLQQHKSQNVDSPWDTVLKK